MYLFWLLKDAEYRRDGATLTQHFHNSSDRKQEETSAVFQGCGLCLTHYRIDRGAGGPSFWPAWTGADCQSRQLEFCGEKRTHLIHTFLPFHQKVGVVAGCSGAGFAAQNAHSGS